MPPHAPQGTANAATPAQPRSTALDPLLAGIVERFRGPLVALLHRRGAPMASELAQDVFAEFWLSRHRFTGDWDDDTVVGPWLAGIAKNLSAAEKRRVATGPRPLTHVPAEQLPDDRGATAAAAEREERAATVRAAIDRLPDELGTAIVMHALEKTPVRRIAALLGVTNKTIEGRLSRARRELARILASMAKEVR